MRKITLLLILSSLSVLPAVAFFEDFDSDGYTTLDTFFPNQQLSAHPSRRGVLTSFGVPSNPLLPVSAYTDKVLYFKHNYPYSSYARCFSNDSYDNVIVDGYVGFGLNREWGSIHVEIELRAEVYKESYDVNSYSISLISNDYKNGIFVARVRRNGGIVAGYPGVTSQSFPVDLKNENYRIRAWAIGDTIGGAIWRVTVENGELVETPIDLDEAPGVQNELSFTNTEYSLGKIALFHGVGDNANYAAFDDITVTVNQPVYRFIRLDTGAHFFTSSEAEKEMILNEFSPDNWVYEGESFSVFPVAIENALPVYRLYNSMSGSHFYTISEEEKDNVLANMPSFSLEGVAFYAYSTNVEGTLPVYRFFNMSTASHFFTMSEFERDTIIATISGVFSYDGIAFYAYPVSN